MQLADTLLLSDTTCHGTVNLVGEPVLAGDSLKLQHFLKVLVHITLGIAYLLEFVFFMIVVKDGFRRTTEEVGNLHIYRSLAFLALEAETFVACHLAHLVERSTLTLGSAFYQLNILCRCQQTHALLRLITYYLLVRQRVIAYWQSID